MKQIKQAILTNICVLLSEIRCDSWHDFSFSIIPLNETRDRSISVPNVSFPNQYNQTSSQSQTRLDDSVTSRMRNRSCTWICNGYHFPSETTTRTLYKSITYKISLVVEIHRSVCSIKYYVHLTLNFYKKKKKHQLLNIFL